MKALVTDGEHRSALAVVRSLGYHGVDVIVVADQTPNLSAWSKYCDRYYRIRPIRTDEPGFIEDIIKIINDEGVQVILPMTDITMYSLLNPENKIPEELLRFFPGYDLFSFASNKYSLIKLCLELGISVPQSFYVENFHEIKHYREQLTYPIIIKPVRSALRFNNKWFSGQVKTAINYTDLRNICWEGVWNKCPFLLQEKVNGRGYGVFALYRQGEPVIYFGHRRLREKPPSGGVSVLSESVQIPQQLFAAATKILTALKWHGPAMVEFKFNEQNGDYHVMEINGRFWGSLQLAIDAGIDFPWLLLNTDFHSIPLTNYAPGLKLRWLLGDLDHHLILAGKVSGLVNKIKVIIRFFTFHAPKVRLEVLRRGDWQPFICEFYLYVRDIFKNIKSQIKEKIHGQLINPLLDQWLKIRILLDPKKSFIWNKLPDQVLKILFVCKGNICRSPFAAKYFQNLTDPRFLIMSAGLSAESNLAPPYQIIEMARHFNVDLGQHQAIDISTLKNENFDLIITMEKSQVKKLGDYCRYVIWLGLFSENGSICYNIPDPYGQSDATIYRIFKIIANNLENLKSFLDKKTRS